MYPYRCTQCSHRFEKIQSFSAEPETVCPKCGSATLERLLTAPALQFKGAGWYVNDYSSKSSSSSESSASSDATTAAAPEAKPAAAGESPTKPASSESTSKPATPAASSS